MQYLTLALTNNPRLAVIVIIAAFGIGLAAGLGIYFTSIKKRK